MQLAVGFRGCALALVTGLALLTHGSVAIPFHRVVDPRVRRDVTSPAPARLAEAPAAGALAPSVVRSVFMSNMRAFRRCYEEALRADPMFAAHVILQIDIGPTGTVTRAMVTGAPTRPTAFLPCLVSASRAMVFPAPGGGGVVRVNYPLNFVSGS